MNSQHGTESQKYPLTPCVAVRILGIVAEAFQIANKPIYQAEKPVRDPLYKRFIKRLPCVACLKTWGVDPCHTGPHGLNQKSSDLKCIPLCRNCHDAFDADPQGFATEHRLDIPALIRQFNKFYDEKLKGRVA